MLQGIESSPEIKLATRQVLEENKRLETLLAQLGVTNQTVEGYLQSINTRDRLDENGRADWSDGWCSSVGNRFEEHLRCRGVKASAI